RPEPHADGRQRLLDQGFWQARLRQEGDHRKVAVAGTSAWDEAMQRFFCLGLLLGMTVLAAVVLPAMAAGERGPRRHGVDGAGFVQAKWRDFRRPHHLPDRERLRRGACDLLRRAARGAQPLFAAAAVRKPRRCDCGTAAYI